MCRNLCSRKGPVEVVLVILVLLDGRSCIPWGIRAGLGRIKIRSARLKISSEEEFCMYICIKLVPIKRTGGGNVDLKHSVLKLGTELI